MMLVKVSSKQLFFVPRLNLGVHLEFQAKKMRIDMTLEQGLTKLDFRLQDFCGQINSQ